MTSKHSHQHRRDAIIGIDPLLNAYFMTLIENGEEVGDPLLFTFHGEDDSPSAQAQVKRIEYFKELWLHETRSFDDVARLYGSAPAEPQV